MSQSPPYKNFNEFNPKKSKKYLTLSLSLLAAGILLLMSIQFLKDQSRALPQAKTSSEMSQNQQGDLEVLYRKIQAQEGLIAELQQKLNNSKKSPSQSPIVTESEVKFQALKDKNHSLQVKVSHLEKELAHSKQTYQSLKENLGKELEYKNQSFSQLQALTLNLEEQTKKLQEQSSYAQSLEEKLKTQLASHSEMEKNLNEEREKNASFNIKINTQEQELKELTQKKLAAEEILNKIMGEFKDQAEELKSQTLALTQSQEQNENIKEEITAITSQLGDFKSQAEGQTQTLNQEKASVTQQLASTEKQLSFLKEELEATLAKRKEDQVHSQSLIADLEKLQQEASSKSEKVETLEKELQTSKATQKELKEEIGTLSEVQLAFEKEKNLRLNQEKQFNALADNLQKQRDALKSLMDSKESLQKEYENLKSSHLELLKKSSSASRSSIQEGNLASLTTPAISSSRRMHTISRGDTLSGISMEYYGTTKKWREIYEANKETLTDINRLKVGSNLIIP